MSNKKEQLKKSKTQLVKQLSKQKRRVLALSLSAPVIAVGLGAGTYFTIKGCSKTNPETPPGPTPPPSPTTSGTVILSKSVQGQNITLLSKSVKKGQDSSFELDLPDQKALKNIVLTIGKTTIGIDVLEIDGGKITVPAEYMTANKIIVSEVELEDAGATGIVLNITSKSLKVGESFEVSATLSFDASTITWSTSGTGSVTLSSNETESGQSVLVTATSAGDVALTATCGEYYAICNITIGSTVKSFSAKLLKDTFGVGTAIYPANLQVSVTMSDGTIQDNIPWVGPSSSETGYDIQYSNSGVWTSIANFDTDGYTFTEIGSCQFRIVFSKDSTYDHYIKVTVLPSVVERIDLNPTSLILDLSTGESKQITPTITPTVYDPSVTWNSLDTNVATVDQDGDVTPVGIGECDIACTSNLTPTVVATCHVKVVSEIIPVTGVYLDWSYIDLNLNESQTLEATVEPENATNKNVTWSVKHPDIASVDQTGKVTGLSIGDTTVIVTTEDGGYTCDCEVNVVDPTQVSSVSLNKSSLNLALTASETLSAYVYPETATDRSVTWSSSNDNVATVDQNGKVTAVAEGSATITAKSNQHPEIYDTCEVTVEALFEGVEIGSETECYIKAKPAAFKQKNIVIPTEIAMNNGTKTVVGIADNGFERTGIDDYIRTITFETPTNIKYIGSSALKGNGELTSFEIPANVKTIKEYTFSACGTLSSLTFGDNPQLETIEQYFLNGCTSLKNFTIPSTAKEIKPYAFRNSSVTSVTFGSSAKWRQTTNISIDVSVATDNATYLKEYGEYATNNWGYTGLTTSDPVCFDADNISETDKTCYASINNLGIQVTDTLTVPEYITKDDIQYKVIGISAFTYGGRTSIATKVEFAKPENIKEIVDGAFYLNSYLETIDLTGTKITTLGQKTFGSCTALKNVTLNDTLEVLSPDSVSDYEGTFYGCTALTNLVIPASVETIGQKAFQKAGSTDGLTITFNESQNNSSNLTIYESAFENSNLKSINLPNRLKTINNFAFLGCTKLETVDIDEDSSLETIGVMAFYNCTSLTSFCVPKNVTTLKEEFVLSTGLTSLTFAKKYGWKSDYAPSLWVDVTNDETNATNFVSGKYCRDDATNTTPEVVDVTADSHHLEATVGSEYAMKATFGGGLDVTTQCTWTLENVTTPGIIEIGANTGVIKVLAHGQTSATAKCKYELNNTTFYGTYEVEVADFECLGFYSYGQTNPTGYVYLKEAYKTTVGDVAIPSRWWYDWGTKIQLCTTITIRSFYGSSITSVTLPSTLQKIDDSCFGACTNLTSIVIPASVTYIGEKAFYNCAGSLTSVTFVDTANWYSDSGYTTAVTISSDPAVNAANLTDCSSSTGWGYTGLYKQTS